MVHVRYLLLQMFLLASNSFSFFMGIVSLTAGFLAAQEAASLRVDLMMMTYIYIYKIEKERKKKKRMSVYS